MARDDMSTGQQGSQQSLTNNDPNDPDLQKEGLQEEDFSDQE